MNDPIAVIEADRLLERHVPILPTERVALADAVGRVLREDVVSARPLPPFDRVTMDGYALASSVVARGTTAFPVEALATPGRTPRRLARPGGCIRVLTGCVLPEGCDMVVPQEAVTVAGEVMRLRDPVPATAGRFVHGAGSDCAAGTTLLRAGQGLRACDLGVLAAEGRADALVSRRPKVALLATGDELLKPGEPYRPGCLYASNGLALRAGLLEMGLDADLLPTASDRLETQQAVFAEALKKTDALLVSGGVSVGCRDFTRPALEACGVRVIFHRVRQKPGLPLLFGLGATGAPAFGLPGNPVSTLTSFARYVRPTLLRMMGVDPLPPIRVELAEAMTHPPGKTFFEPVRLERRKDARARAYPLAHHGSGDYWHAGQGDGFIELDEATTTYPRGAHAPFYPWSLLSWCAAPDLRQGPT